MILRAQRLPLHSTCEGTAGHYDASPQFALLWAEQATGLHQPKISLSTQGEASLVLRGEKEKDRQYI